MNTFIVYPIDHIFSISKAVVGFILCQLYVWIFWFSEQSHTSVPGKHPEEYGCSIDAKTSQREK